MFVVLQNFQYNVERSGEQGHLRLISDLGRQDFSLLPFSVMLAISFHRCSLTFEKIPFYSLFSVLIKCFLVKCFLGINLSWWVFPLHSINIAYYVEWFLYVELLLHSSGKSHMIHIHFWRVFLLDIKFRLLFFFQKLKNIPLFSSLPFFFFSLT